MNQKSFESCASIICPLCNSTTTLITDQDTRETICINCGSILTSDKLQDLYEQQWHLPKEDNKNPIVRNDDDPNNKSCESFSNNLAMHNNGLSTIIGKTSKDATGQQMDNQIKNLMNRLRVWDSRSQVRNNKDRNLFTALSYLQRLKYELGLPDSVIEKTAYLYRKMQETDFVTNIAVKVVLTVASYIACRELDIPRTLKEIAEISNIDEKRISKFYRDLILELDLKVPQADPIRMIIKIANICKTSEKTKRYALSLMNEIIKKNLFSSKDPMGLAGTIIYLAAKNNGENIIQYKIANASGVTVNTLRKNLKFINECLKN
jgi:transcription initiation factor TFIIB